MVDISRLARTHGYSEEEARERWEANTLAAHVGGVKAACTGRNTHKSAFLGWVRLSVFKDGKYAIGMSEAGNASNVQNVPGPDDPKFRDAAYWPIKNEDGTYIPGANGEAYRFFCGRCRRDIQIGPEKLGHAIQTMIANDMKYFDLSMLPFG